MCVGAKVARSTTTTTITTTITTKTTTMGFFSGMNDATRGFSSNLLGAGRYVARIDDATTFEKEGKGRMWKTTLTILAIESQPEGSSYKPGDEVHIFYKYDPRFPKMFFGKIMSFIAGVMDVPDEAIGEAETNEVLSDDNPMRGMVTVVTARDKVSTNSRDDRGEPKVFTEYTFSPRLSDEQIVAAIGEEAVARYFPNGL